MGIFNKLMGFEQNLLVIDSELVKLKQKQQFLLRQSNVSDHQLREAYLNVELKKLERLYVKRKQITQLKASSEPGEASFQYIQHLGKMDMVNERFIQFMIKRLFEEGYGSELKHRGFLPEPVELAAMPMNAKLR